MPDRPTTTAASEGFPHMDDPTLGAVEKWRCEIAVKHGQRVRERTIGFD